MIHKIYLYKYQQNLLNFIEAYVSFNISLMELIGNMINPNDTTPINTNTIMDSLLYFYTIFLSYPATI